MNASMKVTKYEGRYEDQVDMWIPVQRIEIKKSQRLEELKIERWAGLL